MAHAPPAAPANGPHIHLKAFSGTPKENFAQFEGLFRASLAVARIPDANHQRARYLHLHLAGNALNFYLAQPEATRDDVDLALTALRDRYAGADKQATTDALLSNRKFDPQTEEPDDYLTDLQRLALVAIPDGVGPNVDRTDERTRRVRHQFIEGMPYKLKKVLLREPDGTNTDALCQIVKRRLRAAISAPDGELKTAFNEVAIEPSNNAVLEALTHLTSVTQALQLNQQEYDQQLANMAYNSSYYNQSYQPSNNYRGYGRGGPRGYQPGYGRGGNRRLFCRNCGKNGHTQQNCWSKPAPRRGSSIPYQQQRSQNAESQPMPNDNSKN